MDKTYRKVTVRNLAGDFVKDAIVYVGISPRKAVMAAYAQARLDFNTADYELRYGSLVREGNYTFSIDNFAALKKVIDKKV